jgi:hypothetical protein
MTHHCITKAKQSGGGSMMGSSISKGRGWLQMLTTKSIDRKEKKEETAVLTFVKTATAATSVPAVQLRRKNKKTKEKGGMKKKKKSKKRNK